MLAQRPLFCATPEDNKWHGYRCDGYEGAELDEKVASQMRLTGLGIKVGEVVPFGMFGFDAAFMSYDPWDALTTVSNPGLLVYAEHDRLVTPSVSLDRLDEMFDGTAPDHLTTITIARANHGFQLVSDPCDPRDPDLPLSDELTIVLNDWLNEQGL